MADLSAPITLSEPTLDDFDIDSEKILVGLIDPIVDPTFLNPGDSYRTTVE